MLIFGELMNTGYGDDESLAGYIQARKEAWIAAKGTPEEQELLLNLYHEAGELAGKEWNEFSSQETTDNGLDKSATILCQYRILLAEIGHRKYKNSEKQELR